MRQTTLAESLLLNRAHTAARLCCYCRPKKGEAPSNCRAPRLIQIQKSGGVRLRCPQEPVGRANSGQKFCFAFLPCVVFPPYRNSRYCGTPKPGKEKHKSRNYRSAILMVHRFRSFLSVFTPVLRKIWCEVTGKVRFARLNR